MTNIMHDLSQIRASFLSPISAFSNGKFGPSRGVLPNRSGLSSAGSITGGLGVPRHGNNSYGLSTTNNMTSQGLSGSQSGVQGIELYYKRRTGSAAHRSRKAGAFQRGGAPPLEVIQHAQSSLLAKLGAEQKGGFQPADFQFAATQQQTLLLAPAPAVHRTFSSSSSAPGSAGSGLSSSAAAAAAAASAVMMHARHISLEGAHAPEATPAPDIVVAAAPAHASSSQGTARKSVRWSDNLTKLSPEKTGDPAQHTFTSILAVGRAAPRGATQTASNVGSNTGIGGLGAPRPANAMAISTSTKQSADSGAMGDISVVRGASSVAMPEVSVKSVTASQARDLAAHSMHLAAAGNGSNVVGSSSQSALQVEEAANDVPRYRALLEMRRSSSGPTVGSGEVQQGRIGRPSLSEQLAAITASAGALTASIRSKAGMDSPADITDPPIVVLPAKAFSVGTLNCRYPSPARFYRNRIEYTFHHPFENSEILMTMYYADMASTSLAAGKLKFKLPRRLTHFPADFNPNNPSHAIVIELGTTAAFNIIREKIMPLIFNGGMPRR